MWSLRNLVTCTRSIYFSQTCKRRHTRCDERRPQCGNCERLGLECEPSEDATWIVTRGDPEEEHVDQAFPSLIDVFRSRMSELYPEVTILNDHHTPVQMISPSETDDTIQYLDNISLTPESAYLLQTYVRTVATWMDVFDHGCSYQHEVPQLAMKSSLLFHCVCAFTSSHLALSKSDSSPSWRLVAVKHYGEALRLLISALSLPSCEHALTASSLLLSYEIHEAQRSDDYQRHFLGLTMLIKSRGSSAQSIGIERANFWIYVRHEIVVAMVNEQPLKLDPKEWAVSWKEGETREDVLGNHVLWILARVINLIFGPDARTDAGRLKRQAFLQEIETWRASLSHTFVGIGYGEKDEDGFRKVYFPVVAAAAAAFCKLYSWAEKLITSSLMKLSRVSYYSYPSLR